MGLRPSGREFQSNGPCISTAPRGKQPDKRLMKEECACDHGRGCLQGLGGIWEVGEWGNAKQKSKSCFISHLSGDGQSSDFCYRRVRVSKNDLRVPQVMVEAPRTLGDGESTSRQVVAEEINVRRNLKLTLLLWEKM